MKGGRVVLEAPNPALDTVPTRRLDTMLTAVLAAFRPISNSLVTSGATA